MNRQLQLGLKANWRQFALLVLLNAFVGAMIGLERTVVPLLGDDIFALASRTAILSFIVSFGVVKAFTNLFAGRLADKVGRKPVLIVGWILGLPVPIIIIFAPTWGWVIGANVLLGLNQGLCWSITVVMKIDLVGPQRRGLAMGLNEFAGYSAVSLTALASGYLGATYALRPHPFYLGIGFALIGLLMSILFIRETRHHARLELTRMPQKATQPTWRSPESSLLDAFWLGSWKNRSLFSMSQAGFITNLKDSVVWGLLPVLLIHNDLPLSQTAAVVAIYPGIWGMSQLVTGVLSDRIGRKLLVVSGLLTQAAGLWALATASAFWQWCGGSALLGLGTAMVYPTLLAAVSDTAGASWRASALGVFRFWRDGGYAVGALAGGLLADAVDISVTFTVVAALVLASGLTSALAMIETREKSAS
jgi:MFS family permease